MDTDKIVYGRIVVDLNVVKKQDLEKVIDAELRFLRNDLLAACLKRL